MAVTMCSTPLDSLGHVPWLFDILKHFPSANFRRFEIFCIEQARRRLYAEKLLFKDIFSYWVSTRRNLCYCIFKNVRPA